LISFAFLVLRLTFIHLGTHLFGSMIRTPSKASASTLVETAPETPGPVRARVKNLNNQVDELVRKNHALEVSVLSLSPVHVHLMSRGL
jgi:hypothetical protein